jgi:hypothetical protein
LLLTGSLLLAEAGLRPESLRCGGSGLRTEPRLTAEAGLTAEGLRLEAGRPAGEARLAGREAPGTRRTMRR